MGYIARWMIVEWNPEEVCYDIVGWSHDLDDIQSRLKPGQQLLINYEELEDSRSREAMYDAIMKLFEGL